MAVLTLNFCSSVLSRNTEVCVYLPERRGEVHEPLNGRKYPVLYLLHGYMQDHTSWLRSSMLETYLYESDVIVVMPNGSRGFYADKEHGSKYFTYVTEELPVVIQNWFPASAKREDNFVAGLSMGGYGAFKMALRRPDLFAGAASLSGCLTARALPHDELPDDEDLATGLSVAPDMDDVLTDAMGTLEDYNGSYNDLKAAVRDINAKGLPKPQLLQLIGTRDYLYPDNVDFKMFMEKEGKDFDYSFESWHGRHDWTFWDAGIHKTLRHFNLI